MKINAARAFPPGADARSIAAEQAWQERAFAARFDLNVRLAPTEQEREAERERDRAIIALRLASPKRAGTGQHDASDLALFIAADEPGLPL